VHHHDPRGGACETQADIAPGDQVTLILTTVVESGTDITNEVTVTAPGQQYEANLANRTSSAAITVEAPAPKRLAFTGQNLSLLAGLAAVMVLAGVVLLSLAARRPLRT